MENKKFQVPAFISGISTLKDRTLKLTLYVAKELPGNEKATIFDLENKEGWFLFSENTIQQADIPQDQAKVEGRKTLTERLYNTLYVYWSQNFSGQEKNFNIWRENEMEALIQNYKDRLI